MGMNENKYVLVINPGSTSTKIAIYLGEKCVASENLSHSAEEVKQYSHICQQKDMRTDVIYNWLAENNFSLQDLAAVVGRGGLLRPMPGGTYKITYKMLDDLIVGFQGQHASNLGGVIAFEIAQKAGVSSYIVDPVAVDEVDDITRISGMEDISRRSLVHALNIKAVTRRVCAKNHLNFEKNNFVVAHIGGGITVSPVKSLIITSFTLYVPPSIDFNSPPLPTTPDSSFISNPFSLKTSSITSFLKFN